MYVPTFQLICAYVCLSLLLVRSHTAHLTPPPTYRLTHHFLHDIGGPDQKLHGINKFLFPIPLYNQSIFLVTVVVGVHVEYVFKRVFRLAESRQSYSPYLATYIIYSLSVLFAQSTACPHSTSVSISLQSCSHPSASLISSKHRSTMSPGPPSRKLLCAG